MQTFFVEIKCALGKTYAVASALAEELAVHRVELDVDQTRGVVRPLQECAQARKVEGLVLQHRAERDAAG